MQKRDLRKVERWQELAWQLYRKFYGNRCVSCSEPVAYERCGYVPDGRTRRRYFGPQSGVREVTQYLTGKPFSAPVSTGKMTSEEYFIRVGALPKTGFKKKKTKKEKTK